MLRDSFALGNSFVEQYILQSILDGDPTDSLLWRQLIQYPAARVLETLSVDSPREKQKDLAESETMILRLATQAFAAVAQDPLATVLSALSAAARSLSPAGDVSELCSAVAGYWEKAREKGGVSAAAVEEMAGFYAWRGEMAASVGCLKANWRELAGTVGSFERAMSMLAAMAERSPYLIADGFGASDVESGPW